MSVDLLAQPLQLPCDVVLPNRLVKAALSEGLATPDNNACGWHERLYHRWSEGGAGLLITGNVMVHRGHLDRPGNVVIDGHEDRAALAAWARAGRSGGNALWMQINHAGRQSKLAFNPEPMAPSALEMGLGASFARPRAMTELEIEQTIRRMGYAAAVARDAGFTGVQLHGAHGYLSSQFLSPLANQRNDDWGGSLENRARFTLEAVRAMRRAVGKDFPVSVKLNSADFQKGGFTFEESLQVIRWLNDERIDLLEVSGGTYEQMSMAGEGKVDDASRRVLDSTSKREAYFIEYARAIREVAAMPVMVTGGFRSRAGMEDAIASGATDLVGLGRPLCVEPDLPARLLARLTESAGSCEQELNAQLAAVPRFDENGKTKFVTTLTWFNYQMVKLGQEGRPEAALPLVEGLQRIADFDRHVLSTWKGPQTVA